MSDPRRVIVDECLPRKVKSLFREVDAQTVPEAGLAGWKNGRLLAEISGRFEVFVTIDANLEYQQNLAGLAIGIVVIHAVSNRFPDIEPFKEELARAVLKVASGQILHVPAVDPTGSSD